MKELYRTKRLTLKILDHNSSGLVLDFYSRNKAFLRPWEPLKSPYFYTASYHKKILSFEYREILAHKCLRLWLFKDIDFTKTIGTISFNNIIRGSFQSCVLGYKLDSKEIKKGYMSEAIKEGINIMFNNYKLHRIEANIMPTNKASLNLVEKLGFINEGLSKKYIKINGKWEDHIRMALINETTG
ncbi:MAG: GNAT family N-acetyltransferase [Eubacteriales bacterium]